jgi:hypothetical protein
MVFNCKCSSSQAAINSNMIPCNGICSLFNVFNQNKMHFYEIFYCHFYSRTLKRCQSSLGYMLNSIDLHKLPFCPMRANSIIFTISILKIIFTTMQEHILFLTTGHLMKFTMNCLCRPIWLSLMLLQDYKLRAQSIHETCPLPALFAIRPACYS